MPVDFLKIDGGFIRDMLEDPMDMALVESINQIGHVMGIETIAEYVDNPEVLELLRRMGVDYVQGFGVDQPGPLGDVRASSPAAAGGAVR